MIQVGAMFLSAIAMLCIFLAWLGPANIKANNKGLVHRLQMNSFSAEASGLAAMTSSSPFILELDPVNNEEIAIFDVKIVCQVRQVLVGRVG